MFVAKDQQREVSPSSDQKAKGKSVRIADNGGFVESYFDSARQQTVAIKSVPMHKASKILQDTPSALTGLRHPNIVDMYEARCETSVMKIEMEFLAGITLAAVVAQRGKLSEAEARVVFQQMMMALEYIHGQGMAKGNVDVHHMLVMEDGVPEGRYVVKLCGFGSAEGLDLADENSDNKLAVSYLHAHPRHALNINRIQQLQDFDMWCSGVVLLSMLGGDIASAAHAHQWVDQFASCSALCVDLLSRLLTGGQAACMSDILHHPWLRQHVPGGLVHREAALQVDQGHTRYRHTTLSPCSNTSAAGPFWLPPPDTMQPPMIHVPTSLKRKSTAYDQDTQRRTAATAPTRSDLNLDAPLLHAAMQPESPRSVQHNRASTAPMDRHVLQHAGDVLHSVEVEMRLSDWGLGPAGEAGVGGTTTWGRAPTASDGMVTAIDLLHRSTSGTGPEPGPRPAAHPGAHGAGDVAGHSSNGMGPGAELKTSGVTAVDALLALQVLQVRSKDLLDHGRQAGSDICQAAGELSRQVKDGSAGLSGDAKKVVTENKEKLVVLKDQVVEMLATLDKLAKVVEPKK